MSDFELFVFGSVVFAVAMSSTLVAFLKPSRVSPSQTGARKPIHLQEEGDDGAPPDSILSSRSNLVPGRTHPDRPGHALPSV